MERIEQRQLEKDREAVVDEAEVDDRALPKVNKMPSQDLIPNREEPIQEMQQQIPAANPGAKFESNHQRGRDQQQQLPEQEPQKLRPKIDNQTGFAAPRSPRKGSPDTAGLPRGKAIVRSDQDGNVEGAPGGRDLKQLKGSADIDKPRKRAKREAEVKCDDCEQVASGNPGQRAL